MIGNSRRALLIVNERSRSGRASAETAARALQAAEMTVDHRLSVGSDEIADVIRSVGDRVDCVILGGGDGTLSAALPGLLDTGLPLGVIPLGTANDLARTLQLPLDVTQAVQVISANILRNIDVGEVNGIPFLNVASIGFGVDLTRALTRDAKRRWGVFGYLIAALRVLRRMRPFHVTVKIGETLHHSKTVHLAIGNGRHYGGGMIVSEDAAIDDDRLDVYSLQVPNAWALLKILPSMRIGSHGRWSEVETMAGQNVAVETRRPRSVNADGEIITQTPAHFRVLPGALKVYVPSAT